MGVMFVPASPDTFEQATNVVVRGRFQLRLNPAYMYGSASWVSGRPPNAGATTNVQLAMVWRKETDGRWRVAQEVFVPGTQSE